MKRFFSGLPSVKTRSKGSKGYFFGTVVEKSIPKEPLYLYLVASLLTVGAVLVRESGEK